MTIAKPLIIINQWFLIISIILSMMLFKPLLVLPLVTCLITLFTRKNPVFLIGRRFLRKPLSAYDQEDKDQQQFNQFIATCCLNASVASFAFGWETAGYLFASLVVLAAILALLGFCVGCFIRFQYKQWQYRYKQSKR